MKKFKYILLGLPLIFFSACSEEEGSDPGTDTNPVVTMYSYAPESNDETNPDNDVIVRFATNSAVAELYYLVENEDDANAYIDANTAEAYMEKVIKEGTKIDVKGSENIDELIKDQHGDIMVTGVAVNGGAKSMAYITFTGLDWTKICSGDFVPNNLGLPTRICDLERCIQDKNLYRVKDAFKAGKSMKFSLMGLKGTAQVGPDEFMAFYPVRIPVAQTGFNLNFTDGSTSPLWVVDIAGWQGDASFATDSEYMSVMYEDYFCEFNLAWMTNNGCVAYGSASGGSGSTSYFNPAQ